MLECTVVPLQPEMSNRKREQPQNRKTPTFEESWLVKCAPHTKEARTTEESTQEKTGPCLGMNLTKTSADKKRYWQCKIKQFPQLSRTFDRIDHSEDGAGDCHQDTEHKNEVVNYGNYRLELLGSVELIKFMCKYVGKSTDVHITNALPVNDAKTNRSFANATLINAVATTNTTSVATRAMGHFFPQG